MYARVTTWEGAEGDALRRSADEINANSDAGPPPGLPAKGLLMLIDPASGRSMSVVLFETEEDMRVGDEVLNAMTPTTPGTGTRTSVARYEVGVDLRT